MRAVIDELLIGISNETLSLQSAGVHPDRSSKVFERLQACACSRVRMYHASVSKRKRMASIDEETHLIAILILLPPEP